MEWSALTSPSLQFILFLAHIGGWFVHVIVSWRSRQSLHAVFFLAYGNGRSIFVMVSLSYNWGHGTIISLCHSISITMIAVVRLNFTMNIIGCSMNMQPFQALITSPSSGVRGEKPWEEFVHWIEQASVPTVLSSRKLGSLKYMYMIDCFFLSPLIPVDLNPVLTSRITWRGIVIWVGNPWRSQLVVGFLWVPVSIHRKVGVC